MAFNSSDWSIDYVNKTITNTDSGTGARLPVTTGDYSGVGTVLEWFQWLASEFASSAQMDDTYPIESQTPTVYKFLNGWTFGNDEDYKYLQGGSIEDPSGSGSVNEDSLWSNLYSIGTQTTGTQLYLIQNNAEVPAWWITGNIDILIKVKSSGTWLQSVDTSGTLTDGGVWIYAREFGDTYDHNFANISGGGRNPIGINTSLDSGNKSGELFITVGDGSTFSVGNFVKDSGTGGVGKVAKVVGDDVYLNAVRGGDMTSGDTVDEYTERECVNATGTTDTISSVTNVVAGYTSMSVTFGSITRDLNNGTGEQPYDVEIDINGQTTAEWYEYSKYITRYGSTYDLNGDDGQEYRSANEGVYADVKVSPFGTLAGSTVYGARGVWLTNYSSADFVLIDANGTEQAPPNYQKVNVSHESLVGCNIFVAEIDTNSAIIKNQYTISSVTSDTITATANIDINKVPQSGVLRVGDVRYEYTGFSGSDFTGVSPDPSSESGDFYVPLLDLTADESQELSDNIIYVADFNVRTSVRKYGFKPYDVDTTFTATGLNFSPILTVDAQAT